MFVVFWGNFCKFLLIIELLFKFLCVVYDWVLESCRKGLVNILENGFEVIWSWIRKVKYLFGLYLICFR